MAHLPWLCASVETSAFGRAMTEQPKANERVQVRRPAPSSLTLAAIAVAFGLGYMAALLLGGILGLMLVVPTFGLLLLGLIAAGIGLAKEQKRTGVHRRPYVAVLIALLGMILFLIPGLGTLRLLDLHMRGRVALAGGRETLQAWGVEMLEEPRELMIEDGERRLIPEEKWSPQVRKLRPKRVWIDRLFENEAEGVSLMYGGGFLHWFVVIGPPGSNPDPERLNDAPASPWFRWADGVYCRFAD